MIPATFAAFTEPPYRTRDGVGRGVAVRLADAARGSPRRPPARPRGSPPRPCRWPRPARRRSTRPATCSAVKPASEPETWRRGSGATCSPAWRTSRPSPTQTIGVMPASSALRALALTTASVSRVVLAPLAVADDDVRAAELGRACPPRSRRCRRPSRARRRPGRRTSPRAGRRRPGSARERRSVNGGTHDHLDLAEVVPLVAAASRRASGPARTASWWLRFIFQLPAISGRAGPCLSPGRSPWGTGAEPRLSSPGPGCRAASLPSRYSRQRTATGGDVAEPGFVEAEGAHGGRGVATADDGEAVDLASAPRRPRGSPRRTPATSNTPIGPFQKTVSRVGQCGGERCPGLGADVETQRRRGISLGGHDLRLGGAVRRRTRSATTMSVGRTISTPLSSACAR